MTPADGDVTLATLSEQLNGLSDLFRRRLLEDRAKHAVIEDLQARLTRADKATAALALKPLVDGLALVIERLQSGKPSVDLISSIGHELEDVLESVVGVKAITAVSGEAVDRLRHEVTSVSGEGTELRVAEMVRTGYEKAGVVLRPAKVTAVRVAAAPTEESDAKA